MSKRKKYLFANDHIGQFCRSQWKNAIHIVGITILALSFTRFVAYDLKSLSALAPMEKMTDIQMSDIYQSVSESKAIHQLSREITVVNIEGCSRAEVLEATNLISEQSPAVIGLDAFFPIPEVDNSFLLSTFPSIPQLVCAAKFEESGNNTYSHIKQSFYEDSINVTFGYVNLNASTPRDIIREFVPYVLTPENDTLISFPAQLARLYNLSCYNKLISRGKGLETIAFDNIEFPIISIQEVLDGNADVSLISNKIILIGDNHNINDTHLTPISESLSGIMLHAYALQTILSCNYIDPTPTWLNWLIAIALCLLFAICNLIAKYHLNYMDNFFVRIVQFVMIYVLVIIGCVYYSRYHNYIDFSPAIMMIGFGEVAFDVWFGFYALYNMIKNKIVKK